MVETVGYLPETLIKNKTRKNLFSFSFFNSKPEVLSPFY